MPRDRITENVIAEQMSASRGPRALMRLQRGASSVFYRSGWQIRPVDFQQFEQPNDVRVILEMAAVSRLCELQPTTELEALQAIWLVPIEERQSHGPSVCQLDEHFHLDLVRACGNPELARIHHDLTERLRIVRRIDFTRDNRIEATYREHAEILHSITQRRADQVAADQDPHRGKQSGGTQDHTAHAVRGTATPGRQPPARMTAGLSGRPGSGYHPDDKDVLTVGHTSAKREIDP